MAYQRISPLSLREWQRPLAQAGITLPNGKVITLGTNEIVTTDEGRLWRGDGTYLGGSVDHGPVADASAMAAIYLQSSCMRGVHPGDTCWRSDMGCEFRVISGHNSTATWRQCAVDSGAAGTATWGGIGGTLTDQTDLGTALAGKQANSTNLTALAAFASTAVGRAFLQIGTPDLEQLAKINPDGSVTLIDVPSVGGGSALPSIKRGLEVWLSCTAENAAVDLHGAHATEWVGTPAGATGKIGRAFSLNGSSHVRVTNYTGLQAKDRHGWTCCAWVKTSDIGWVAGADGDLDEYGRSWYGYVSDAANCSCAWSSDGFNWVSHNISFAYGSWCFIAVICDPLLRSWRGLGHTGIPVTTTLNGRPNVNAAALAADLCFGSDGRRTCSNMLTGLLDGCAYWSRPLGAEELAYIYNGGAGRTYASLGDY